MNDNSLLQSMIEQATQLLKSKAQLFPPDYCQWREAENAQAKDGPYQPTGIAMLDHIATTIGCRILYGGNESCNAIEKTAVDPKTKMVKADNALHFIRLPDVSQFVSPNAYAATLAHELIHWVETRTRKFVAGMTPVQQMLVKFGGASPPPSYIIEEMAAEMGAGVLLQECGGDPCADERSRYTAQYMGFIPEKFRGVACDLASKHALEDVSYLMKFAQ